MKTTIPLSDNPECKNCGAEFDLRLKRPVLVKALTFWMPLKRFHCSGCVKNYYVVASKSATNKNSYIMFPSMSF